VEVFQDRHAFDQNVAIRLYKGGCLAMRIYRQELCSTRLFRICHHMQAFAGIRDPLEMQGHHYAPGGDAPIHVVKDASARVR